MQACVAIIVASGRGARFGHAQPKQYLPLLGRPLLRHTLKAFADHPKVSGVRAVIHEDDVALYEEAAEGIDVLPPVFGGDTRQDSVRHGLESLVDQAPPKVLIHDGARPLVSADMIDRVVDMLDHASGVVPALPIADTLKKVRGGVVGETLDRNGLFRAQTPQGFAFEPILKAHRKMKGQAMTDDAAVAEANGLAVTVVAGDDGNLKVTEKGDLERAAHQLNQRLHSRTGMGFDVHRLEPGDQLTLLGLNLPEPFRMIGHSDADVGLHAITDALLGALAVGDIGSHFPPSDPTWKGADSAIFLRHACTLIEEAGGLIDHIDITIICERPKIGRYREVMVQRLAELMALPPSAVSVKATTTEGLGFTGRGEGIAAQAVATVMLPR